jgi:phytoene dehydrogenase-like protein
VSLDAVVVGSGPNGLAAAVELARAGASVRVLEAMPHIGGGLRSAELTLPGFLHDVCSGAHPLGLLSPFFSRLPLREHGLEWAAGTASVAHPLDDQPAVLLRRSLDDTAQELGADADRYRRLLGPLLRDPQALLEEILGPLVHLPRHPVRLGRYGVNGILPATLLGRLRFREPRARALLAGCAAHSVLPLESPLSGGVGLLFLLTGHLADWPVARGGSQAIADALASYLRSLGGEIETDHHVRSTADLPPARIYLFDTSPSQLAEIAAPALPAGYVRRLRRFRYGPAVFKMDWALDGPIPWADPQCLQASTVHLGGTMEEVAASEAAVWRNQHAERPFVLVIQQSLFDPGRAPEGRHTGYAYCHVPEGSTRDLTEVVERQVERFAPGFRDRILARHAMCAADLQRHNPNLVGGAITGGVADVLQMLARPAPRLDPYTTPNPRVLLCSASTPPGGGVHGMCGYRAARRALRHLPGIAAAAPLPG